MKFTNQEIDMLKILVINELNYYESKEDDFEEDKEYVNDLKRVYKKLVKDGE